MTGRILSFILSLLLTLLGWVPGVIHACLVVNDYQAGGLTMYLARDVAKRVLGIGGVDAYAIQVDHAQLATVRAIAPEFALTETIRVADLLAPLES